VLTSPQAATQDERRPRRDGGQAQRRDGQYLPLLLQTASAISADWAAYQPAPQVTVDRSAASPPAPAAAR
jgi:hypothetical protein